MARTTDGPAGEDKESPGRPSARARLDAAADRPTQAVKAIKARADKARPAGDGARKREDGDPAANGPATKDPATKDPAAAPAAPSRTARASLTPADLPSNDVPPPAPTKAALRNRILPRSVLGISGLILAFAIGAGFSGVVLFSYYQYKLNQTNDRVNALITGYKSQFAKAEGNLRSDVDKANAEIQSQLKVVQQLQASPAALATLTKQVGPSVFFVHTLDASGAPSVGTAFVVSSNATQSLLITSYTTVAAATHAPAPGVFVKQGSTDTPVTVRTWDTQYDLALLVLPRGSLPALTAAPPSPAPQPGDRLYAVSGLGTAGASIAQGTVVDVSASGLAVDASVGTAFQGGPMINQQGQVVAVSSRSYSPLGFSTSGIWYSPYVEAACSKVLSCPGGTLVGSH